MNKIRLVLKEDKVPYIKEELSTPNAVVKFFDKMENISNLPQESAFVMCLNNKNKVIAYSEISRGGAYFCNIDRKILFQTILLSGAAKFILVHNHPSGDTTPSKMDIQMTKELIKASKLLDLQLLDHIVIGRNNFTSCMLCIKREV